MVRMVKIQPFTTAVEIRDSVDTNVSEATIRRRLLDNKLPARRPSKKPHISRKNRVASLKFTREHLNCSNQKWRTVLFSDESKFNFLPSDGIVWVRRLSNKR